MNTRLSSGLVQLKKTLISKRLYKNSCVFTLFHFDNYCLYWKAPSKTAFVEGQPSINVSSEK